MLKRNWALIAFVYFSIAEALSFVPVPDLALCLVEPEHGEQSSNHNDKKYCPAFHIGAALAFEKVDSFLEHHDKSVVGGFTIVLAISTIGLWLATNKLWEAGEKQFGLLRDTSVAQSRDMRESMDHSRKATETAVSALALTEKSIETTKAIGQAQVRAYLSSNSAKIKLGKGHIPTVELSIRNNGQSPARNVRVEVSVGMGAVAMMPVQHTFIAPSVTLMQGRDDLSGGEVDRITFEGEATIPTADYEAFMNAPWGLCIVEGNVFYTDIFGEARSDPVRFQRLRKKGAFGLNSFVELGRLPFDQN